MEIDHESSFSIFIVGTTKMAAYSRVLAEKSTVLASLVSADASSSPTITLPACISPAALASLLAYLHMGQYASPSPDSPANAVFTRTDDTDAGGFNMPAHATVTATQSLRNKALGFSLPQLASTVASPTALIELFALCSAYQVDALKPLVAKDVVAVLSPGTAADMLRKARECVAVVPAESGFGVITETVERYVKQKMDTDPDSLLNPPSWDPTSESGGALKREIKEIRRKRVKE
jgi:hypothetical protein